jgi:WASH complex subunit 7
LDRLYYDEVAVTQHKWRGFEEQRNLAREKYGLNLTDSLLPGQTQDNELDVLQIMRLIHVFARTYHYNLNNQIFVQHESEGKNLNSINVDIIADSIRTHGIGIMNTTVNFTFQFLKQRFITFSQFLFDDHISARLYKDGRFFKKERAALNNCYPYDRADKFNKEIRKLGMDKGLSYLDKFRLLIAEIGKRHGIHSNDQSCRASLHQLCHSVCSRSSGFFFFFFFVVQQEKIFSPFSLKDIPVFEDSAKSANLSKDTQDAARILDNVISNLSEHFSVGTEYFVTLVNVFAKEFRDPKVSLLLK